MSLSSGVSRGAVLREVRPLVNRNIDKHCDETVTANCAIQRVLPPGQGQ